MPPCLNFDTSICLSSSELHGHRVSVHPSKGAVHASQHLSTSLWLVTWGRVWYQTGSVRPVSVWETSQWNVAEGHQQYSQDSVASAGYQDYQGWWVLCLYLIRVASGLEKSGKFDIFSRSGNCQGILKIGQWKIKILKSQGKVRKK